MNQPDFTEQAREIVTDGSGLSSINLSASEWESHPKVIAAISKAAAALLSAYTLGRAAGIEGTAKVTHDYRDTLHDLAAKALREEGLTPYRTCKRLGVDSGWMSNLLAKRIDASIPKLLQFLDLLGYDLAFIKREPRALLTQETKGL